MDRPRHLAAWISWLVVSAALMSVPGGASAASTGDPAANRSLGAATESYCAADPVGTSCINSALADINAAHAGEGVRPMVLPRGFASMSVPIQLLNLANLERVDRGLRPILGLSEDLDQDAQTAAAQDRDPMPTHFYGTEATGNWAAGYDSTLEADFAWMYDDGLGSDNLDCTSSDHTGCWGHRKDILWQFASPIAMGAGSATGQYGPSLTELFVGGDTRTALGQPDAPVVKPAAVSAAGLATGHAASGPRRSPNGWARSVAPIGSAVHVTVGCMGSPGRVCTLRLVIAVRVTRHNATAGSSVVRVAAGHRRVCVVALGHAARRLLRTRRALRARLVVEQGGKIVLRRTVSFRAAG